MTNPNHYQDFLDKLDDLINGKIKAQFFEKWFWENYRNESIETPENTFEIFDRFCDEVDAYCSIEEARGEEDLDEDGLIEAAKNTLELLRKIQG
jgi:hypothetical protein